MAKKNGSQGLTDGGSDTPQELTESPAGASGASGPPKGFDIKVGQEQGDGWLVKTSGQVIIGRMLGRYAMRGVTKKDGSARVFYQFLLMAGCTYVRGGKTLPGVLANQKDESGKAEVVLGVGKVVNVDEHKTIEELGPYTRNGGVYNVWFRYVEKKGLARGGGESFWMLEGPHLQPVKPATRKPDPEPYDTATNRQSQTHNEEVPEGEIPF